ncbi:MAG: polysaccharide biosynthesis/export family protein [Akkermansia sp.]
MNNKMIQFLLLCALLLVPGMAQDNTTEPRAIKGGRIQVIVKNIPAEDTGNVNGEYSVNRGDGTISLPYLSKRIHVEGLTARDIESVVRSNYLSQQIYADPIVQIILGAKNEIPVETRFIQVSGYVGKKSNLPYREGITLIEALLDAGDITDYGSRKIQITRGGVTRTYDYFSAKDRGIKLLPKDVIYVPRRPAFEGRPGSVGP